MTKRKQLLHLIATLSLLSSCAHIEEKIESGPSVTSCIVDIKAGGYQCAALDESPFFLAFKDASELQCVSSKDLEAFLKACKMGKVVDVPKCMNNCADNSYCLVPKDWARISERCNF